MEDEAILRDAYKLVLDRAGHTVHTASHGAEGLAMLQGLDPDLILLDVSMPILDGKGFLKHFDRSSFPNTKIIVFSNQVDHAIQKEMLDLGADEYALKLRIKPQELTALINKVAQR